MAKQKNTKNETTINMHIFIYLLSQLIVRVVVETTCQTIAKKNLNWLLKPPCLNNCLSNQKTYTKLFFKQLINWDHFCDEFISAYTNGDVYHHWYPQTVWPCIYVLWHSLIYDPFLSHSEAERIGSGSEKCQYNRLQ